jgi:hypothetical protein
VVAAARTTANENDLNNMLQTPAVQPTNALHAGTREREAVVSVSILQVITLE